MDPRSGSAPEAAPSVLIVVDPNSGLPVYRQIMDQIRFHIASGLLNPGDELPSTRALSEKLGVNPMTVSKTYSLLEREGVLERRAGLPLIVSDMSTRMVEREGILQLEAMLEPAVLAARQLGLTPLRAMGIFRRLLEDNDK
jgi:GntR family transcriptional regulator